MSTAFGMPVTLSIGTPGSLELPTADTRQLLADTGKRYDRQPLAALAYAAANAYLAHRARAHRAALNDEETARIGADVAIHPFATVGPDAEIGSGCTIHSGARIGAGCRIGSGTVIFPNAVLYDDTRVGARCIVHAGAVLGAHGGI